ncbi:MAG: HNH endonuclease signature motif containing protein [Streptosporangiaceae bacterium]
MVLAGLGWLASCDTTGLPNTVLADCLRDLESASAMHAAARGAVLSSFCAHQGYADDGQGSPRTWLRWQTRITGTAASAAVAQMRRQAAHPAIARALGTGRISVSWSRQICDWTDRLPEDARDDADVILLGAADGGADLADLAALADQMRRRLARPDQDGDDGFEDRAVRLTTTFDGAGRLDGDLTPRCAAAVEAVIHTLGKRMGPEDTRTVVQRNHDALEEACRRLIASGCLPERAGQPTQIQLHLTLDDLLGTNPPAPPGTSPRPEPAADVPQTPAPAASPGDDCDATIIPVVSGQVDHELLRALARQILSDRANGEQRPSRPPGPPDRPGPDPSSRSMPAADEEAIRDIILRHAVDLLSGPDRLGAWLRTARLSGPAASVSLPLDVGAATDSIPAHLRRAVILRDRHCAAPGCDQRPAACQIHHIRPRSEGGATSLSNLLLLCTFHHLILIHRWGWTIRLNSDGTTTATSPDGRTLRSHAPPPASAA